MNRPSSSPRALQDQGLAIAGYVDAVVFVLTGLFVLGSLTALPQTSSVLSQAVRFAGLVAGSSVTFVGGFVAASLLSRRWRFHGRSPTLAVIAALLALAALLGTVGMALACVLTAAFAAGARHGFEGASDGRAWEEGAAQPVEQVVSLRQRMIFLVGAAAGAGSILVLGPTGIWIAALLCLVAVVPVITRGETKPQS